MIQLHHFRLCLTIGFACMTLAAQAATDASSDAQSDVLDPISVTGLRITSETNKLAVDVRDLPQDVTIINSALMQLTAASSLDDLGHLSAAIQPVMSFGGVESGGYISRGFSAPLVVDGVSTGNLGGYSGLALSTELLASSEILSGPAAITFGQGAAGGLVNLVTTKPQSEFGWMAKAVATTENQKILVADFTGNLLPNVDGRVLLEGERSDSYIDFNQFQRNLFAPQIHWQITDKLGLSLKYMYDDISWYPYRGFGYTPSLFAAHLPISFNLGDPHVGLSETPESQYRGDLHFVLSDDWTFHAMGQYYKNATAHYAEDINAGGTFVPPPPGSGPTVIGRYADYDTIPSLNYSDDLDFDFFVRGAFSTWPLKHQITLDASYQRGRQSYYGDTGSVSPLNYADPLYPQDTYEVPTFIYNSQGSYITGTRAVAAQDLVSLGEHIKVMGGVRYDWLYNYYFDAPDFNDIDPSPGSDVKQQHLSKQGAVIYRPIDSLTFYATYSDAFNPSFVLNFSNTALPPVKSINREIGVKAEFFDRRVTLSGAIYRIFESNIAVGDLIHPGYDVDGGDAQSKGFEVQTNAAITQNLHLGLGLAHTTTEYLVSDYIPYGDQFPGVPKWTVVVSGDYQVAGGMLDKLRLFTSTNYNDKVQSYLPNADAPAIPHYVRMDLGASYPWHSMLAQLNLKNTLNQRIILSNGSNNEMPEAPRTLWLTLSWRGGSLKQ